MTKTVTACVQLLTMRKLFDYFFVKLRGTFGIFVYKFISPNLHELFSQILSTSTTLLTPFQIYPSVENSTQALHSLEQVYPD
jgi:hypothetical protein